MTIKQSDPIRQDFAACSTGTLTGDLCGGAGTYKTKGHAIQAFDSVLSAYGLSLVTADGGGFNGDSGRAILGIYGESVGRIALAAIAWYRLPSGRYEFVGYIA